MATKSSSKNKKASSKTTSRSVSRTTSAPAKKSAASCDCTVKECLEQHPVLRFHAVILGVLSIIICLLVAILLLSLS